MELLILEKYKLTQISTYLAHREFECKCVYADCTFTLLNPELTQTFNAVRFNWGSAIGVTSGFRCQRHNKDVGGFDDSWHKRGSAIDIYPHNNNIDGLYILANKFFDLVIHYEAEGFLHCQMET